MAGRPGIVVLPDVEALALEAHRRWVSAANASLVARGRFQCCLTGGSTPERLYRLLSETNLRPGWDWARVEFYLSDERRVATSDPLSNGAMIERALRDPLSKKCHFFHMAGDNTDGNAAAWDYEELLRGRLGSEGFDLMLLGIGPDGHVGSIFPHSSALGERERWVLSVDAPTTVTPKVARLTLTPPALLNATRILILAAGEEKAGPLARLVAEAGDERETPIRIVRRFPGAVTVLCDPAAAKELELGEEFPHPAHDRR